MTEDEVEVQFQEIIGRVSREGVAAFTDGDAETMNAYMKARMTERKAAERAYAVAGLDVPWWSPDPPIKVWEHDGVVAAITPCPAQPAFNGYVLLPEGHPWREADLQMGEEGPDAHGGITFGPHVTGWIGFDTAHAGDNWHPAELLKLEVPRDVMARWRMQAEIVADIDRRYPIPRESWDRWWTVDGLIAEINDLAAQVGAATPTKED